MPGRRTPEAAEDQSATVAPKHLCLPAVSHLQFLILDLIRNDAVEVSAQELQNALSAIGIEQRGPKFYQLMKRLEEGGLIKSWQQRLSVAGSDVHRSFYMLTGQGVVAWRLTREFYAVRLQAKNAFGPPRD